MADEINIKFGGDTGELDAALKRVTGEIGKLNTQVEKTGEEIQDAFSAQSRRAIEQMRARTRQLRQSVKRLSDENVKAIKSTSGLVSSIAKLSGGAFALQELFQGARQAVDFFVGGIVDAITSADEFIEELEAIQNPIFDFSETTVSSIEKVNVKLETMTGLSKALRVQLAEEFTPVVSTVTDAINNLALIYGKANKAVIDFTGGQLGLTRILADFLSAGSITKIEQAAEALNVIFGFQKDEVEDLENQFSTLDKQLGKTGRTFNSTGDDLTKNLEKLAAIEFRADQKTLEGVEKISAAYSRQFLAVYNIEQAINDLTLTEEQRVQAAERIFATLEALHEAEAADKQKFRDKEAEENQKALDARLKREKKAADERLALLEDEANKALQEALRFQEGVKSIKEQNIQAVAEFMGETSDIVTDLMKRSEGKNKAQAKAMFAIQKATAIAQATINGALAVSQALTQFPGPPVTFPLAKTVGAMALVNVAQIAAQSPSFHIGTRVADLAPDEMRITRREGLAVLTPQGMQSGGAEAVANANAGINQSGQQTVVFMYEHQMFDATIEDNVRRPNSPLGAMIRRSSYGHRRRNG